MIYVAPTAIITGDVTIDAEASLWYGTVVRGDLEGIAIGEATNVQDGAIIHTDVGSPASIGRRVTIGHGAIVHGCRIGDDCIIGMHATVSSGAIIRTGSIVAPGAVVPEGKEFAAGSVLGGVPAQLIRSSTDTDRVRIEGSWRIYVELAKRGLEEMAERVGDPSSRTPVSFLGGVEP